MFQRTANGLRELKAFAIETYWQARRPTPALRTRQYRALLWMTGAALAVLLLWLSFVAISPWMRVGFNYSDSLDGAFFVVFPGEMPQRGDRAALCPPPNAYKSCFYKVLKGLPGDVVTRRGRSFYLNGEYLGDAKEFSLSGNPLQASEPGVIPPGHYFFWTPHKDSYDSRYAEIGLIPADRIIGRAVALF